MGRSHSKISEPTNPFEIDKYKRELYQKKYRECEKQMKKRKKSEEKLKHDVDNSDKLNETEKGNKNFNESDYDMEAKNRMQDQLAYDSQTFVLNQLMLTVQFYGNFEKEMRDAVERNRKQENEQTNKIQQHCKIVLLPNRLYEAVDRHVKFKARHGPSKGVITQIHHRTLFVIHENIEITHPGEPAVYSILTDAPVYKMEIDIPISRAHTHVGYCRLKSNEIIRKTQNPIDVYLAENSNETSDQNIASDSKTNTFDDDEEILPKFNSKHRDSILVHSRPKKQIYGTIVKPNSTGNIYANTDLSNTSTGSQSPINSEYEYAYMTSVCNHQPLGIIKKCAYLTDSTKLSSTTLPDVCISSIAISSDKGTNSNSESDEEQQNSFEMKQFLNSKAFLAYFLHIFQDTLANTLGISKSDVSDATWMGAIIYGKSWEVIPAIACPWPKEAFEWIHRHREIHENPVTKQKFQWPTRTMINKVIAFGCHVIPIGFTPKTGFNTQRELEWKIVFPEAERYLESCLTNTQIKVLIITKALLKTFIEPYFDSKTNMLTMEHLRAQLFWQCEHNYAAWPEDYLGEALLRYLKSLLENVKRQKIPDYFLPRRNLFENISSEVLVELHKRIFRIIENPVMHLLIALKNLKFYPEMFPRINFKKIYSAIIIDNPLKIVNPMFRTKNDEYDENDLNENDDDDGLDIWSSNLSFYAVDNGEERLKTKKKKRVKFIEMDKLNQQMERTHRRISMESIDVKAQVMNHMEQIRRIILYETFIQHFIEMAKTFLKYQSWNQSLIYLKQASRICGLLADDERKSDAQNFLTKIDAIQHSVMVERNRDVRGAKPRLPIRQNSLEAITKQMVVNIHNQQLPITPIQHYTSRPDTSTHYRDRRSLETHAQIQSVDNTPTTFNCVNFFEENDIEEVASQSEKKLTKTNSSLSLRKTISQLKISTESGTEKIRQMKNVDDNGSDSETEADTEL